MRLLLALAVALPAAAQRPAPPPASTLEQAEAAVRRPSWLHPEPRMPKAETAAYRAAFDAKQGRVSAAAVALRASPAFQEFRSAFERREKACASKRGAYADERARLQDTGNAVRLAEVRRLIDRVDEACASFSLKAYADRDRRALLAQLSLWRGPKSGEEFSGPERRRHVMTRRLVRLVEWRPTPSEVRADRSRRLELMDAELQALGAVSAAQLRAYAEELRASLPAVYAVRG